MTALLTLLLGILVVVLITAVTGYFVAQEFAYMAVDRSTLAARAAAGDAGARRALTVTGRTSFMLSGAQLGITVTGLLVGYVAEPLIGESLGTLLGGVGVPAGVGIAVGAVLALLFATVVQMLFGELFPKNLAIARPEPVALWLARSTVLYLRVFGWLVWVFDQSSNLLLRALRIEPVHDVEHAATARDLEHIVEESRESGNLPVELSMMLDRILDFPSRDVEHAMIPRSRVAVLAATDDLGTVRARMATGHSRYPVLSVRPADGATAGTGLGGTEDIVGVVHLVDLLTTTEPDSAPVSSVVRPALVVSTLTPLPDVLRELSESRNQLACAVDEYGGFAGVVTLEDLAEELVGEITDEHDDGTGPSYVPVAGDGVWEMSGDVHVDEVERALGADLPRGDYETVAGLVLATSGGLVDVGATLTVELPPDPADLALAEAPEARTVHVTVLAVDRYVPSRVRLELPGVPSGSTAAAAGPAASATATGGGSAS
ncbi:hemolysin family protein [Aquipuribacter hungaricus]|uniref:Hemolysin family protein n=1 Tax=Aquipuribacter hungaricus TaxID=545624 RepID=A0ABV7WH66_9MICO